ncbi:aspartate aminotransferase family protein [Micromonospora sp. NPDC049523]|uniref:aspartate aminotransferase family protein n=1 Tax=Micromonospora sp. NPDC049523 TaxID=3155921 RepID=UPI003435DA68
MSARGMTHVGMRSAELLAERDRYVAACVATSPVFVERAHGARLWDVDGREYIDFAGGIGSLNGGHTPPDVIAAIHDQADRYLHIGYSVAQYEPYIQVCKRLVACHPGPGPYKAVLVNSGVEAVELAVKVARAASGRPGVICFDQAFHGRTLLGATLSYKARPYKRTFGPLAPGVYRAAAPYPYRGVGVEDSLLSIRRLLLGEVDPAEVAAVIYEPVQGEGGFLPAPPDFLPQLQDLCREHGILLIADEIQSGMCRTGLPAATMHYEGVEPDIVAWGKSMGGGMPVAGVTGRAQLMDAVHQGGLASGTFGGNPVSCAASIVALDQVLDPGYQDHAQRFGDDLRAALEGLAREFSQVGEVRGLGAMLALELITDPATKAPATRIAERTAVQARERGLIVKTCGTYGNVIRILVPLVATPRDVEEGLAILTGALRDCVTTE